MKDNTPYKLNSVSELHQLLHLPKPKHPLFSLVDNSLLTIDSALQMQSIVLEFYGVSYKKSLTGKFGYGQGYYDFDEGGMIFTAPHQVIGTHSNVDFSGYTIFMHPDFIQGYPLATTIRKYGFFNYDTNEALHLSETERDTILGIFRNIENELNTSIDETSQDVLVSYLEVLLNYSQRFYKRQFITRKVVNNDLLTQMERLLNDYFSKDIALTKGLPTVEYLAEQMHVSARYLSDMLRSLTGLNARNHIHDKLIEKAKEYLSTTNMSVSEIAYQLGFERPQSFNKIFKQKTELSPLEFRETFN